MRFSIGLRTHLFNTALEVLGSVIRQEKKKKYKDGKGRNITNWKSLFQERSSVFSLLAASNISRKKERKKERERKQERKEGRKEERKKYNQLYVAAW